MKEKRKSKKLLFGIILIIIIIVGTWITLDLLGYHPFMKGYEHTYGYLEIEVEYPYSNVTNEEIISAFRNSENNLDIINYSEYHIEFTFINTTLTQDELSRFETIIHLQSEMFDRGVKLQLVYHSNNKFSEKIYNDKEKKDFEKKANEKLEIDKIIIYKYLDPLTSFLNNTLQVGYKEIDFGDNYIFVERI